MNRICFAVNGWRKIAAASANDLTYSSLGGKLNTHMRSIVTYFAFCWIALSLMFPVCHGTVICFGSDGHVDVETDHHGSCHGTGDQQSHPTQAERTDFPSEFTSSENECLDIPLTLKAIENPNASGRKTMTAKHPLFDKNAACGQSPKTESGFFKNIRLFRQSTPDLIHPLLSALSTVVLQL